MSLNLNQVQLLGRTGRDAEIRSTQGGTRVGSFSLATSVVWNDKASGERKEKTQWHRIVIWNEHLVGVAEKWLRKGSHVYLEGALEYRKYTDQAGTERDITEIVLGQGAKLILLDRQGDDSAPRGEAAPARAASDTRQRSAAAAPPRRSSNDMDDDIPF